MTTKTSTTDRTGYSTSTKARGSRKIARSMWYGMFLGSLPLTSFSFWLALLIAAFVETRLLVVVAAALLTFGLHTHTDPLVEPIGQFVLGHDSTQPYLSQLASIPVLQNIEWYNTLICGYTTLFIVGLPIVYVLKKSLVYVYFVLFRNSKQLVVNSDKAFALEQKALPQTETFSTTPLFDTSSVTEAEMVEDVAEKVQSTIDVVQTALQPAIENPTPVSRQEHTFMEKNHAAKPLQEAAPKRSKQERRKLKQFNKKTAKQTQKQIAANSAPISMRSSQETEKVIIVHPLHETKVQAEPHHFTTQPLQSEPLSATLYDQVWQGDLISDGIVQQSSIEDVIETLPTEVAHQVTCEIVASEHADNSVHGNNCVSTIEKPSKRKKLTVKETIIDIIRWKKPESSLGSNQIAMQTNLSAIESSTTSISVGPLHATITGSKDVAVRTEAPVNDEIDKSPVLTVFTTSMNAEPLPFLLGYLSGAKRSADKPGGS